MKFIRYHLFSLGLPIKHFTSLKVIPEVNLRRSSKRSSWDFKYQNLPSDSRKTNLKLQVSSPRQQKFSQMDNCNIQDSLKLQNSWDFKYQTSLSDSRKTNLKFQGSSPRQLEFSQMNNFHIYTQDYLEDDGRMFITELLYCEGRNKPLLRGYLHAFAVLFLLPGFVYHAIESIEASRELTAIAFYITGKLACFGTSSLFHCFSWNPKSEILLQKLDHSFIFIKIACVFTCFTTLLYPTNNTYAESIIAITMLLTWTMAIFGVHQVFNSRDDGMKNKILTICCGIPAYSIFANGMTQTEQFYCVLILLFHGMGGIVFSKKVLNIFPNTFGYHEVFHFCTLVSTVFSFLLLFSLTDNTGVK